MKKLTGILVVLLLLLGGQAPEATNAQSKQTSKLMAAKLQNSQKLLEGIATTDFNKITRAAEELLELTKTEEWQMYKTPRYQMHSNEFQRAAETLIHKAKEKNIDGTTLAFFEMTMSCVRCHQHVREIRDARAPDFSLDGLRVTTSDR
jgi:cytochrome c556